MMKKIFLLTACLLFILCSMVSAADIQPTKKVVLFYRVSDAILQAQNSDEDILRGQEELEKELKNHYGKRFIVQDIQRNTYEPTNPPFYQSLIKPNQTPFLISIELVGEGVSVDHYQNAFGAQTSGYAPSISVHLIEAMPSNDGIHFIPFDYGVQSYSAGTFSYGMGVYATQTDPRKNVKNAVRASFRDACKYNDKINKYVDPFGEKMELARYTGDFEKGQELYRQKYAPALDKIKKFEAWCNADTTRQPHLSAINSFPSIDSKMIYINQLEKMGVYKES